jgi:two-component system response regulator AtoC
MSPETSCVLLVDDDPAVGKVLGALLEQEGIISRYVGSGAEALRLLDQRPFDVVVTDLRMPEIDGMLLMAKILEKWPDQAVIMLTAHGTVQTAVEAMKVGARDFLLKPFDADEVVHVVRRAIALAGRSLQAVPSAPSRSGLLGQSPAMAEVSDLVARAARSNATILLRGESGTGKEVAARAVHALSARNKGPFIALHCASLPDTLLESELFGHEKGAFTGAATRKPGRIELAHGGTLFLDEIGDVPLSTQVKLLRVLQERELERIGGTVPIKVDARFVAATHRDLEALVAKGQFREDLFFRLNVVPVFVPPLRERPGDTALLARHFFDEIARANERTGLELSEDAVSALAALAWPGNVRQLQNFIERLIVLSDGPTITSVDVEREIARETPGRVSVTPSSASATGVTSLESQVRESERQALLTALQRARNNRTQAARLLGVSRRTLYNRLEEHGLLVS